MHLAVINRVSSLGIIHVIFCIYIYSDKSMFFEIGIERPPTQGCNQWTVQDGQNAS